MNKRHHGFRIFPSNLSLVVDYSRQTSYKFTVNWISSVNKIKINHYFLTLTGKVTVHGIKGLKLS